MAMRQFTIELRVDYEDQDKNGAMKEAMQRAARHLLATAALLKDNQQPEIVIYGEDFFVGREEIPLMEDTLGKALEDHDSAEIEVSDELRQAARDLTR